VNKKVLVVVAHPDDEVLGCGATIAKHIKKGDEVQVVFIADGFSSRHDGENRNFSAIEASKSLGCNHPIFLNFPDNRLDTIPLLDIVQKLESIVFDYLPNIVYTHHLGDLNIDHQVTNRATMTACRPHQDSCIEEIYACEILSATHWNSHSDHNAFNPNYFVEVSDYMDLKNDALQCYSGEMRDFPNARSFQTVKNLASLRGSIVGVGNAEAFLIIRKINK